MRMVDGSLRSIWSIWTSSVRASIARISCIRWLKAFQRVVYHRSVFIIKRCCVGINRLRASSKTIFGHRHRWKTSGSDWTTLIASSERLWPIASSATRIPTPNDNFITTKCLTWFAMCLSHIFVWNIVSSLNIIAGRLLMYSWYFNKWLVPYIFSFTIGCIALIHLRINWSLTDCST
jgi:hypothetical protein